MQVFFVFFLGRSAISKNSGGFDMEYTGIGCLAWIVKRLGDEGQDRVKRNVLSLLWTKGDALISLVFTEIWGLYLMKWRNFETLCITLFVRETDESLWLIRQQLRISLDRLFTRLVGWFEVNWVAANFTGFYNGRSRAQRKAGCQFIHPF